jgi:hypothetical protein
MGEHRQPSSGRDRQATNQNVMKRLRDDANPVL